MPSATIKLFLTRGDAKSLRTAEISNWTGKAIAAPRTEFDDLLQREERDRTGVYILSGNDPLSGLPRAYIGEAEVIRERLKQHKTKEFWVSAIVFVSKDDNLTKAHVRYIEGRLLTEAQVGRCTLEQNQAGGAKLPESDRVDYGRLPFVCSPTFASSRLRSSDSNCTTVRQAATRRNLFLPHEGCGGARSPHAGWLCHTSRFYCRHGATQLCEKVSVSAYTP